MNRKLILEEWLSLDGHVSDKEGKLDFFARHVRESYTTAYRTELLDSIDTILFGRKTYTQFAALWPERPVEKDVLAEKINTLDKIVFSASLEKAPWGRWKEASIADGNPAEKITQLKSSAGKNMILWGSITLAQTLIKKNLVDEYHLHICPVLTGGGRKLFADETEPVGLSLLDTKQFDNGLVLLKYGRPE
jgi:dihydrofolate reductase